MFIYSTYFLKSKSVKMNKKAFIRQFLDCHRIVRSTVQQEGIKLLRIVMKTMSFLRMTAKYNNRKYKKT